MNKQENRNSAPEVQQKVMIKMRRWRLIFDNSEEIIRDESARNNDGSRFA